MEVVKRDRGGLRVCSRLFLWLSGPCRVERVEEWRLWEMFNGDDDDDDELQGGECWWRCEGAQGKIRPLPLDDQVGKSSLCCLRRKASSLTPWVLGPRSLCPWSLALAVDDCAVLVQKCGVSSQGIKINHATIATIATIATNSEQAQAQAQGVGVCERWCCLIPLPLSPPSS